jgi:hypothetical protein
MAAKLLYTAQGSDPTTLVWPPAGPPYERWTFTNGQTTTIPNLIVYNNMITFPDGRQFPTKTPAGSTLVHQKT